MGKFNWRRAGAGAAMGLLDFIEQKQQNDAYLDRGSATSEAKRKLKEDEWERQDDKAKKAKKEKQSEHFAEYLKAHPEMDIPDDQQEDYFGRSVNPRIKPSNFGMDNSTQHRADPFYAPINRAKNEPNEKLFTPASVNEVGIEAKNNGEGALAFAKDKAKIQSDKEFDTHTRIAKYDKNNSTPKTRKLSDSAKKMLEKIEGNPFAWIGASRVKAINTFLAKEGFVLENVNGKAYVSEIGEPKATNIQALDKQIVNTPTQIQQKDGFGHYKDEIIEMNGRRARYLGNGQVEVIQ